MLGGGQQGPPGQVDEDVDGGKPPSAAGEQAEGAPHPTT